MLGQKIPTLFKRDLESMKHVTDEVVPGCEWVLAREGVATRKYDGTCTMLDEDGRWWARREVKPGKPRPDNFYEVSTDETTGKTMGWEPIAQSAFSKFHAEACAGQTLAPGTYELCGPKVNGNPEHFDGHRLVRHADAEVIRDDGDVHALICYCNQEGFEGVVWHHPDGRMAKLKVRDFS
jgi:hypothetical protein